jgi:hypothetical protein
MASNTSMASNQPLYEEQIAEQPVKATNKRPYKRRVKTEPVEPLLEPTTVEKKRKTATRKATSKEV